MFKAKIRLYSFGPYLISVDEGQEIFSIDLSSLYNLHPILSTKQSPKNMTLLIDGRTCNLKLNLSLPHLL